MPELPEVETVRRGLEPFLTGAGINKVTLNRPDLRFAFPPDFADRLTGQRIVHVGRRAKYLLFGLSSGETLLSHLGMTGNYRFGLANAAEKHDHVLVEVNGTETPGPMLIYSDPRRFGFMDLFADPLANKYLAGLGPEPLGNDLNEDHLALAFAGRRAPVKSLLLDQRIVAGLGNIYVSEALHMAGIHPETPGVLLVRANGKPVPQLEALTRAIRQVLEAAILSGGSTLQDYRNIDGSSGYFQHSFAVYDHEGEACRRAGCTGTIARIVQSGRSSFFCPVCQPKPRQRGGATRARRKSG